MTTLPPETQRAVDEVGKYLTEYAKLRQHDQEQIHGLHIGDEREAILKPAHLRKLLTALSELQAREAVLIGALENIASDEKPELGNRNTNDLLARMYWLWATDALVTARTALSCTTPTQEA